MQVFVSTALCVLAIVSNSHAWSALEHKAAAEVAQDQLTSATNTKLAKILGDGSKLTPGRLAQLSMWPDEIRAIARGSGPPADWSREDLAEAEQFNTIQPNNEQWHAVDLPVGAKRYPDLQRPDDPDPARAFIRQEDMVHKLIQCIAILEEESSDFTKKQAVRWLIHLAEDIHQPLHTTSGYYDPASDLQNPVLIRDPQTATDAHAIYDRRGHGLLFSAAVNLHAVWDDCLVKSALPLSCSADDSEENIDRLAARLRQEVNKPASKGYKLTGDHHRWPEQWATDSLSQAAGKKIWDLELQDGVVLPRSGEDYVQAKITSPTKKAYLEKHKDLAIAQLTRASMRLAQLLNTIDWK